MGPATDARVALLERLLDHAPLFPPASLPLEEAVSEDRRARQSESVFMLGRFVCPASRLPQLPDLGRGVSAVLDAPLPPEPRVEAVEAPPGVDPDGGLPEGAEVFVETPLDDGLEATLDRLAQRGLRAKVRCGAASVPDVRSLARFVRACRERGVPFKATAGLHHAVGTNGQHGFLNLLAAAAFPGAEEAALAERDPAAFRLDERAFSWRDRSADARVLAEMRATVLRSIGSCSFFEPLEDLEALDLLPL